MRIKYELYACSFAVDSSNMFSMTSFIFSLPRYTMTSELRGKNEGRSRSKIIFLTSNDFWLEEFHTFAEL